MQLTVCDELIAERLWRAADADWPREDWPGWHAYPNGKLASRFVETAPSSIRRCLELLAENAPCQVPGAFPDLSFYGSGLHEVPTGLGLAWHKDAARHPLRPWQRVATAIMYLDHGGDLVFRGEFNTRVTPQPGRVVSFAADCEHCVEPSTINRRSLAVFFYVLNPSIIGAGQAVFNQM